MQLEHFSQALSDPSTELTYPALTGARKQSVVDAERLFNPNLAAFMRKNGYEYEAKYIETIWNWRRACDERGLPELQRSKFNHQFLNMILEELMPWFKESYDFSLLEVNRYYTFQIACLIHLAMCLCQLMHISGQSTIFSDFQRRRWLQLLQTLRVENGDDVRM